MVELTCGDVDLEFIATLVLGVPAAIATFLGITALRWHPRFLPLPGIAAGLVAAGSLVAAVSARGGTGDVVGTLLVSLYAAAAAALLLTEHNAWNRDRTSWEDAIRQGGFSRWKN